MGRIWEFFISAFMDSIASIDSKYFLLPRYENRPARRERAYCYELYHQLRLRVGDSFPYTLHGEIDKRGSKFVDQAFQGHTPNPDFVVHVPDKLENLAVIEVKPSNCQLSFAQKDILKITTFIERVDYQHGIFLVYGLHPIDHLANGLVMANDWITFLWHRELGVPPEVIRSGS